MRRAAPLFALALLGLLACPARAEDAPAGQEMSVPAPPAKNEALVPAATKDGLHTILLTPASAQDIGRMFPEAKQYVDHVRSMEFFASDPGDPSLVGANSFSFALLEDKDLATKLLFLYIEGPSSCGDRAGCSLYAFADDGNGGFQKALEVLTPPWLALRKKGRDLALVLSGNAGGTAKWSYLPNPKEFSYAGLDDIDDSPAPETIPALPQRIPPAQ